jgi:hypothetical protein
MIKRIIIAVFSAWILISCSEDEVVPRTNPRFSVAFVQTVDASGVEFAANMVDYGSEEILEHGFVFGSGGSLSVESSEIVRASGSPASEFRLKATYGMKAGDEMIVSAFIKTESGVVYSLPYSFVSQGSDGFVFERYEVPSQVYFGDTIRVFAKFLPRSFNQYSVEMQGKPAVIAKVGEGYFDFLIPRQLSFEEQGNLLEVFSTDFMIAGKALHLEIPLDFKDAEFAIGEAQEINYSEDLVIYGRYLGDEIPVVSYVDKSGEKSILMVESVSDDQITVDLTAYFEETQPELELTIRGKTVKLDGLVKLRESKIDPGQTSSFYEWGGYLTITGENFNPHSPEYNRLEFSKEFLKYNIVSVTPTEMEITYEYDYGKHGYRTADLYMTNAGIKSSNSVVIEWTAASIPILMTWDDPFPEIAGRALTVHDKGYLVASAGIFEIDPLARTFKKLTESPVLRQNPARIFAVEAEGKIYFGANYGDDPFSDKFFYSFDPKTNKVEHLPNIPSPDNQFQSVVYYQGAIYYQGDFIEPSTGHDGNLKRYRFNLGAKSWEKLPDLYQPDGYRNNYAVFRRDGAIFSIGITEVDNFTMGTGLFKFDIADFTWKLDRVLDGVQSGTEANEIMVMGDKAYYKSTYSFFELDFKTSHVREVETYTGFPETGGFKIGDKFYYFFGNMIREFDPHYF